MHGHTSEQSLGGRNRKRATLGSLDADSGIGFPVPRPLGDRGQRLEDLLTDPLQLLWILAEGVIPVVTLALRVSSGYAEETFQGPIPLTLSS
jgi:hypothetical protein